VRAGFDQELRELQRAYRADPRDEGVARRYLRLLDRGGDRDEAVRVRFRLGERVEACADVEIRWEADDPWKGLARPLGWGGRVLTRADLEAKVGDDLVHFDPVALADAWPKTKAGLLRLNTTLFLRRYQAYEDGAHHRRLYLLAWTPGTSSNVSRPEDAGRRQITVALETRSTRRPPLPAEQWRS
jgi:hypothetical protein